MLSQQPGSSFWQLLNWFNIRVAAAFLDFLLFEVARL